MTARQAFVNTVIVLVTVAVAYALVQSVRTLVVLLVAIIVASAIRPIVLRLERARIPYGLGILLVYLSIFLVIIALLGIIIPPSANSLAVYIEDEDRLASRLITAQEWLETRIEGITNSEVTLLDPNGVRETVQTTVQNIRESVPAFAGQFGGLLGDFVLTVLMGIYWLTSRDQAVNFVTSLFPLGRSGVVNKAITEIEQTMGAYLRGVVLVAMFVGFANAILLAIFGVPNPATLGVIIGVMTLLPVVGGFIGAGAAVFLSLLAGPSQALITFGVFVAVQQVEQNYLTPRTMSRSVNLNPILVLLAIFIGSTLGGVIGAIIAVPVFGSIMILIRTFIIEPMQADAAPETVGGTILLASVKEVRQAEAAAETAAAVAGSSPPATSPTTATSTEPRILLP